MRHLFWGLFLLKRDKRLNNCEKWALKNTHNNATRPNLWVEKSAPAFSFFWGELYFQINVRPSNFKNLASFSAKDQRNLFLGELQLKSQNSFGCDIFFEILSLKRNSRFCTSPHFSDHCGLLYFLFSFVFLVWLCGKKRLPTRVNELSLWWEMRPVLSREPESFFRRLTFLWNVV